MKLENIKEKAIQHKGKIIGAAAVVGVVGLAIATGGRLECVKTVRIQKRITDLSIPEGMVGVWDLLWKEKQINGAEYLNAIIDKVDIKELGAFGDSLIKAGYSEGDVGLIVGQNLK